MMTFKVSVFLIASALACVLPTTLLAQNAVNIDLSCQILDGGSRIVVSPGPPPFVEIDGGPKISARYTDGNVTKNAFQVRFTIEGRDYMFVLLPKPRQTNSGQLYHAVVFMLGSEQEQRNSMRLMRCE